MDKYQIINHYSKADFMSLLQKDYQGDILSFFDEEGIQLLKESPLCKERLNYILTYSRFKNELLQRNDFLELFLNGSFFISYIVGLTNKTYDSIFTKLSNNNYELSTYRFFFESIDSKYLLERLDNWNYSQEILYYLLNHKDKKVTNKIFEKYNIDLTSNLLYIDSFALNCKESSLQEYSDIVTNKEEKRIGVKIPNHLITNHFIRKMWLDKDIYAYRKLIDELSYSCDTQYLNKYSKHIIDKSLSNIKNNLIEPYITLYSLTRELINNDSDENYHKYYEYVEKNNLSKIGYKLRNYITYKKEKDIYECIYEESNKQISNYIIDYHFEDNYFNVHLDLNELLKYYYDGNISLDEESLNLYQDIFDIDKLDILSKIELHNKLKKLNVMEMFYDDMSFARKIVREEIINYSLNKESIKEFIDPEMSKKYGVDIYNINGNKFFGIVKSCPSRIRDVYPTGHSYSLIGNAGIAVFNDENTYLYDSSNINPDQIVHVFPEDSYTLFKPFEAIDNATNRVNALITPQELVQNNKSYNEILILEKGSIETDLDKQIPNLEKIAVYCKNQITEKDIEKAKNNQIGILFIDSSLYEKEDDYENNPYYENYNTFDGSYEYFNGSFEKDTYESRR